MPPADDAHGPGEDITELLRSAEGGDDEARERLWRRVYDELRAMARRRVRSGPAPGAIEPTSLVHDAWVRLGGRAAPGFESRTAFFRAAASAMRNALVDEARRAARLKRGGDRARVPLEEVRLTATSESTSLVALDAALARLEAAHPRVGELVELRYFAGLTMAEAARALGIALATAERDWRFGRTWLRRELERGPGSEDPGKESAKE